MSAPAQQPSRSWLEVVAGPEVLAGAVITLLAFAAYWFTGPQNTPDSFVPLADAFAHGLLSIAMRAQGHEGSIAIGSTPC